MSINDFAVCRQEFRLLSLHGMATACFRLGEVVSRILMLTMFSCAYNVPLMGAVMAVDFFILVLLTNSQRRLNYPGSGAVPRILVTSGDTLSCVLAVLVSTACSRCFGIVRRARHCAWCLGQLCGCVGCPLWMLTIKGINCNYIGGVFELICQLSLCAVLCG